MMKATFVDHDLKTELCKILGLPSDTKKVSLIMENDTLIRFEIIDPDSEIIATKDQIKAFANAINHLLP